MEQSMGMFRQHQKTEERRKIRGLDGEKMIGRIEPSNFSVNPNSSWSNTG